MVESGERFRPRVRHPVTDKQFVGMDANTFLEEVSAAEEKDIDPVVEGMFLEGVNRQNEGRHTRPEGATRNAEREYKGDLGGKTPGAPLKINTRGR